MPAEYKEFAFIVLALLGCLVFGLRGRYALYALAFGAVFLWILERTHS